MSGLTVHNYILGWPFVSLLLQWNGFHIILISALIKYMEATGDCTQSSQMPAWLEYIGEGEKIQNAAKLPFSPPT